MIRNSMRSARTRRRSKAIAISMCLVVLGGCMGESASDKMLRMAKARAAFNKANAEHESDETKAVAAPSPEDPVAAREETTNQESAQPNRTVVKTTGADEKRSSTESDADLQERAQATLVSRKQGDTADDVVLQSVTQDGPPAAPEQFGIPAVNIGSDGKLVVYQGENGAFGVYDVEKKSVQRQFFAEGFRATSVAINEERAKVVLGGEDGSVKIFSTDPFDGIDQFKRERILRDEQNQSLIAHDNPISAIAIRSSDGAILTGDGNGQMRLWSGDRHDPIILPGSESSALALQTQGDGSSVFAATADQQVVIWKIDPDREDQAPINPPRVFASLDGVPTAMATGLAGRGLVVGDEAGNVVAWTAVDGSLQEQRVRAHDSPVIHAALIDDGKSLITAGRNGEIAQWSLPLPAEKSFRTAQTASPILVTDESGEWIAMRSGKGRNLDVYRASDGKPFRRFSLPATIATDTEIVSAAFDKNGKWLVAGDSAGNAQFFQMSHSDPVGHVRLADTAITHLMSGSGDESSGTYAFVSQSGGVGVLATPSLESLSAKLAGDYRIAAISDDGKTLAGIDSRLQQVHFVALDDSAQTMHASLASISGDEPTAIAISGRFVLIGTRLGTVAVWDVRDRATSQVRVVSSGAHTSPILAIGTNDDGHVWSCDATGQVVHTAPRGDVLSLGIASQSSLPVKDGVKVDDAAISPDGQVAYVTDGTDILHRIEMSNASGPDGPAELTIGAKVVCIAHDDRDRWLAVDQTGGIHIGDRESTAPSSTMAFDESAGIVQQRGVIRPSYVSGTLALPLSDGSSLVATNWHLPESIDGSLDEAVASGLNFVSRADDADLAAAIDDAGQLLIWRDGQSARVIAAQGARPPLACSADGRFVASSDAVGRLNLWSTVQAKAIAEPLDMPAAISALVFDNESKNVFLGLANGAIQSVSTGGAVDNVSVDSATVDRVTEIGKVKRAVTSLSLDPTGQTLAVGDESGDVSVCAIQGEPKPAVSFSTIGQPLNQLTWSADGESVYFSDNSGTLHQRSIGTPEQNSRFPLSGASPSVETTTIKRCGKDWLLIGYADGTVRLVPSDQAIRKTVRSLSFRLSDAAIATSSEPKNSRVKITNVAGQSFVLPIPRLSIIAKGEHNTSCVAIDPSGREIWTGDRNTGVRQWKVATDGSIVAGNQTSVDQSVVAIALLSGQDAIVTADGTGSLMRWDRNLSKPPQSLDAKFNEVKRISSIGRTSQVLVQTASNARVIDIETGRIVPQQGIDTIDLGAGGTVVATGLGTPQIFGLTGDGRIKTNRLTVEPSARFSVGASLRHAVISGSKLLAVASRGAILFDAGGARKGLKKLPDGATLAAATLSSNGVLAALCDDRNRLWTFGLSHEAAPIELPNLGTIQSVKIAADHRTVAVVGVTESSTRIATIDLDTESVIAVFKDNFISRDVLYFGDGQMWLTDNQHHVREYAIPAVQWRSDLNKTIVDFDYSDSAEQIYCVDADGGLTHMDSATGRTVCEVELGDDQALEVACIRGTGTVAVMTNGGAIGLYEGGTPAGRWLPDVAEVPRSTQQLTCRHDGTQLLAIGADNKLLLWSAELLNAPPSEIPLNFGPGRLALVGDGQVALSARDDAHLRVISTDSSRKIVAEKSSKLDDLVVFPDQSNIAVADGSSTVRLISVGGEDRKHLQAEGVAVGRLAVHPRGVRLAGIGIGTAERSREGQLVIWDMAKFEVAAQVDLSGGATKIVYSPDGSRIAIAKDDNTVQVRDGSTGELVEAFATKQPITSLGFDANSERLLFGREGGEVVIQEMSSLGLINAHSGSIDQLAFAGTDHAISGGDRGQVKVWNVNEPDQPPVILQGPEHGRVLSVDLSDDGDRVVAVFDDPENQTCIWDVGAAIDLGDSVAPGAIIPNDVPNSVGCIVPDGTKVLVADTDGVIHAWSVADATRVARFEGHTGSIADLAVTPDGTQIISGGMDRSVRTWEFPAGLPSAGKKVPLGALAATSKLDEPEVAPEDQVAADRDPLDDVRQQLIEGTDSQQDGNIFDLFPGDTAARTKVKRELELLKQMEQKVRSIGSATRDQLAAIARAKSGFFDSRRDLTREADELSERSFSRGHKNLIFAADTNYDFNDGQFRPVKLAVAGDRYVYAARKSNPRARGKDGDGSLAAWDFGYSGVKTHSWSSVGLNVQEIYPSPDGTSVVSVPDLFAFANDGTSQAIASAARWAVSPPNLYSGGYLFAVGTQGALKSEEVILRIFDGRQLLSGDVVPVSQFSAYEGLVTAMAYAKKHRMFAFCIRERSTHRLYLADPSHLNLSSFLLVEEVDHTRPYLLPTDENGRRPSEREKGAIGITSIEFSPDDETLVVHGQYEGGYQFKSWSLKWDSQSEETTGPEIRFNSVINSESPIITQYGSKPIHFIRREPKKKRDPNEYSITMGTSTLAAGQLVAMESGGQIRVYDIRTDRFVRSIPFVKTHWGRPEYHITDDGRWMIMGDDNGKILVTDLLQGKQYSLTVDGRPAHAGPVVGVTLSEPDPALGFPAYAATVGEENQIKVWDLILPLTSDEAMTEIPSTLSKPRRR